MNEREHILEQVRRALWLNRGANLHFPGALLQVEHGGNHGHDAHCALQVTPAVADDDRELDVGACLVLADMTLGLAFAADRGSRMRVATVSLAIDMTGVPRTGRIEAVAQRRAFMQRTSSRVGLADVQLSGPHGVIGFGRGSFMLLPLTDDKPLPSMTLRTAADHATAVPDFELDPLESAIFERALAAQAPGASRSHGSFLARFWGYDAQPTTTGANARMQIGPHVGNRVGHVHGGVLCGVASHTAGAALGEGWMLSRLSASFLAPGVGQSLSAAATVVHRGNSTAIVDTMLVSDTGRKLMDVTSTFLKRAPVVER